MATRRRWFRTDQYFDTEISLRKAAELASAAERDPAEWKWLVIAIHSATQGMFVLSLSRGNRLSTVKAQHAAAWIRTYNNGQPWPTKMDLDYFPELYKKSKKLLPSVGNSVGPWFVSEVHDDAVQHLNDLRNGFLHFGAHGWTINLAALPRIGLLCMEIAAYLGWESGQVCWRSGAQSNRARRSMNSLRQGLARLSGQLS